MLCYFKTLKKKSKHFISLQTNICTPKPKHPEATHITIEYLQKDPHDKSIFARLLKVSTCRGSHAGGRDRAVINISLVLYLQSF